MEDIKAISGEEFKRQSTVGRRSIMKMGVGVGAAAMTHLLDPPSASAQSSDSTPQTAGNSEQRHAPRVARAGYQNNSGRASGNGPMDAPSKDLVMFASSFSEARLKDPLFEDIGYHLIDTIACLFAGFESEPARISARMARTTQSNLKSTVLGYGVTTTPDLAAFANNLMVRHNDFNDNASTLPGAGGGHFSDMIPAILAVGEAQHSSGLEVLAAITLGYELVAALQVADKGSNGWDRLWIGPAAALAVGKLLKLTDDQLANALSISIVPHVPLSVSHSSGGPLSMWKGCHTGEAIRCAVFAALLARDGMTGPCAPFEGNAGLWDKVCGPFKALRLPVSDDVMVVQRMNYKRFPAEGGNQAILEVVPQVRDFTKVEDIASIDIDVAAFGDIGDAGKWDPRNEETADHSMPYVFSRALIDGEIFLDSFTKEKFMDPAARAVMEKITIRENPGMHGARVTVRTKAGAELVKESASRTPMSHDEVIAKFNRVCAFKSISDATRDRTRATWTNLKSVRDIAEPMHALAHFGKPQPL